MKTLALPAAVALLLLATPLAAQEYEPYALPDPFAPLPGTSALREWMPSPSAQVLPDPSLYRPLRPLYPAVQPIAPTAPAAPGGLFLDPYARLTIFDRAPRAAAHDAYPPVGDPDPYAPFTNLDRAPHDAVHDVYTPSYDPDPYVPEPPAVEAVVTDNAERWHQMMREWRFEKALEAEEYHRAVQRKRWATEDADLNALRVCAKYNRGCFNELGGRQ